MFPITFIAAVFVAANVETELYFLLLLYYRPFVFNSSYYHPFYVTSQDRGGISEGFDMDLQKQNDIFIIQLQCVRKLNTCIPLIN